MTILLVGEYSGLHNSLKKGLIELGHEVILAGTGDGFKNFNVDLNYETPFFSNKPINLLARFIKKVFDFDLISWDRARRFRKILPKLSNFDLVQLINEKSIKTDSKRELKLLKELFDQNKKVVLLSCGLDYLSVKYAYEKKFRYSILTPLFENKNNKDYYRYILDYLSDQHRMVHNYIFENIHGVIASDLDYHLPLIGHPKYLGLVPNPVSFNTIEFKEAGKTSPIRIFHGVNRSNYIKKGNRFFDEALSLIAQKYGSKIEIIRTENMPYSEYIEAYDRCDILLDQVYAYDQGYNALEAMAKGKVVFTGAEKEWQDHYNLEPDTVAINALPDITKIVEKLESLIENPEDISKISKNARRFIESHHHYKKIAQSYLELWNNT